LIKHPYFPLLALQLGFPFLLISTVLHPQSVAGRLLEWKPLRGIGRISYSLYLWQQLFFIGDHVAATGTLHYLQHGPWNLIATFTLATASYFLLEKPTIRLGHRFAPPATPGHKDLTESSHAPA
jgi:peptidoglycan/LPS O-acetylase OafA/YrhL